jgi:hypothetical protein
VELNTTQIGKTSVCVRVCVCPFSGCGWNVGGVFLIWCVKERERCKKNDVVFRPSRRALFLASFFVFYVGEKNKIDS